MSLAWIVYSGVVGLIGYGATLAVTRVVRSRGRSERWIWTGGLVAALALPFLLPALSVLSSTAIDGPTGTARLAGTAVALGRIVSVPVEAASRAPSGAWVPLLWLALSSLYLARLCKSRISLGRIERRGMPLRHSAGRVRVTAFTGPGVVGLFRPRILLPEWVVRLPAATRNWVLRHEIQHVRGHDPLLHHLVFAARALAPWNPAVWGLSRGLQRALETDCDRRVLRARPDPRAYAETLIDAARRGGHSRLVLGAFDMRVTSLRHRIITMTNDRLPLGIGRTALLTLLAAVALLVACDVNSPAIPFDPPLEEVEAARVAGEPVFTPYTVAPAVLNRSEVMKALEDAYPVQLRDAGIGGRTTIWFFVTHEGILEDLRVHESSGVPELDRAAMEVGRRIEFSPALNKEVPVDVWVALPITFSVR